MDVSTRTYFQGIWEFSDFPTYVHEWVIPYMLKDLETVFEGARRQWVDSGRPEAGRGDFILSTALFALFDHLGSFMGDADDSLQSRENIARCARKLRSTEHVDLIVGLFGRNALVHRGWPQTMAVMDGGAWAFGLNVTANPDESDHLVSYWRHYRLPNKNGLGGAIPVLKLRVNVQVLWREFVAVICDY